MMGKKRGRGAPPRRVRPLASGLDDADEVAGEPASQVLSSPLGLRSRAKLKCWMVAPTPKRPTRRSTRTTRAALHAQRRAFDRREAHREAQIGAFPERYVGLQVDAGGTHVARAGAAALELDGKVAFETWFTAPGQHGSSATVLAPNGERERNLARGRRVPFLL